jgi:lysophospholipase L1-like esterase
MMRILILFFAILFTCFQSTFLSAGTVRLVHKRASLYELAGSSRYQERHVLQVSDDFRIWSDVQDRIYGGLTNLVDMTGVKQRYFRLIPSTELPLTRVVLLGDSTVADFASNGDKFRGWGEGMHSQMRAEARTLNLAMPMMSSKSFLRSEEKDRLLAIKPAYVLIQFGLGDAVFSAPEDRTTLEEFRSNLHTIVQMVRDFSGTPILVTPQALQYYDASGKITPVHQEWNGIVKEVASELQVYLIDLNKLSIDFINALGKEGSEFIWAHHDDVGHFSQRGAEVFAGLVINALPADLLPYATPKLHPPLVLQ